MQHKPSPDEAVSLRALDPDVDPNAAQRFEQSVFDRIRVLAVRAPASVHPLVGVSSFARVFAIAAAIIFAVTLGALMRTNQTAMPTARSPHTIAEAIGVPPLFLGAATSASRMGR